MSAHRQGAFSGAFGGAFGNRQRGDARKWREAADGLETARRQPARRAEEALQALDWAMLLPAFEPPPPVPASLEALIDMGAEDFTRLVESRRPQGVTF